MDELSGGQRQRVWIAMALAQQTDLLLLDEPTTFLDTSHQVEALDLLTDLNHTRGTTIVMVRHDLNLAARYPDHLVAMAQGRLHASGRPEDVLTAENVRDVFGPESRIIGAHVGKADHATHRPAPDDRGTGSSGKIGQSRERGAMRNGVQEFKLTGTAVPMNASAMHDEICEHFVEHSDVRRNGRAVQLTSETGTADIRIEQKSSRTMNVPADGAPGIFNALICLTLRRSLGAGTSRAADCCPNAWLTDPLRDARFGNYVHRQDHS